MSLDETNKDVEKPYEVRSKDMSFNEALLFMEESLTGWSSGELPPSAPRSEGDLFGLLRILEVKSKLPRAELESGRQLNRSVNSNQKDRSGHLVDEKEAKLARLREHMKKASGEPQTSRRQIGQMQRREKALEAEIKNREFYEGLVESPSSQESPIRSQRAVILGEVRRNIDRVLSSPAKVKAGKVGKAQWMQFSSEEGTNEQILALYESHSNRNDSSGSEYDRERLFKAFDLKPTGRYRASGGFDGYIVFTFKYTEKALMECPYTKNAIYIIGVGWEYWSHMTKQDVRSDDSGNVVRIEHRRGWYEQVKRELDFPS